MTWVPHAGIGDLDQHLAGLEHRDLDLGHDQWRTRLDEQGGFSFHLSRLSAARE